MAFKASPSSQHCTDKAETVLSAVITVSYIFSTCGTLRCVLMWSIFNNCARALARALISRLRPPVEPLLFFMRYVVVTTGAKYMAFTLAHC